MQNLEQIVGEALAAFAATQDPDALEQIKARLSLGEVVSDYVNLTAGAGGSGSGSSWRMLMPPLRIGVWVVF